MLQLELSCRFPSALKISVPKAFPVGNTGWEGVHWSRYNKISSSGILTSPIIYCWSKETCRLSIVYFVSVVHSLVSTKDKYSCQAAARRQRAISDIVTLHKPAFDTFGIDSPRLMLHQPFHSSQLISLIELENSIQKPHNGVSRRIN